MAKTARGTPPTEQGDIVVLRQARVTDVPALHALIGRYAEGGAMLARPRSRLYDMVRDFVVAEEDGRLVGCGALRTVWEDLGEICSLAVEESRQRQGIGRRIVQELLGQAAELGLGRVFVLTYILDYFSRFGFRPVEKAGLPHKVWAECVNCPKFPDCGEQAMVRELG